MRIGIIGAGQLGQMLGFAARKLGHTCTFLDPSESPPAGSVGPVIRRPFDDEAALAELASGSDVLTYEFENVSVESLAAISADVPVYPPLAALRQSQDRLVEKQLFERLGIPLPAFRALDDSKQLEQAAADIGVPLVVKTRRMGYDGKGQALLTAPGDAAEVSRTLGGSRLIAEAWVGFDFEISAIGVRTMDACVATYPVTRNEHAGGILRVSRAPVDNERLAALANEYLTRLLDDLDYVGVLALEMFVVGERLLANEFAPRVHNSGHWTIEGAKTSQFENHIRAITGRPAGSTQTRGHAGMVNLIGSMPADRSRFTGASRWLHDYGKTARPGRKLGHVTILEATAAARDREIASILDIVTQNTGAPDRVPWQET